MKSSALREISIEHQQQHGTTTFPLAFAGQGREAADEVLAWLAANRQQVLELASLHGAILFRDGGFEEASDFDGFVSALQLDNFSYRDSLSNAVRVNFTERVFSANEAPSDVKIYLHHELAQTPRFPTYIAFFCEVSPAEGGATPLCRSDVLYDRLLAEQPEFIASLRNYGLKYSNVMPGVDDPESGMGRSWQSTLGVETRSEAEQRLQQMGYSWEWSSQQELRATTPVLPAIREVAPGKFTLFNQLIAAYSGWSDPRNDPSNAIRLGNEQPLSSEGVSQMIALADELTFDMPWQTGDVALLDNTLVMHGRRPFRGRRKVLASLGNPQSHAFA